MFEACSKNIKEAEVNLAKIDQLTNDSEIFIYEFFEEIKRQVDHRRETLKVKIDDYSDDIINKINQTQKKCYILIKTVKLVTAEIEKIRNELNQFTKDFDTFVKDEKIIEVISLKVNKFNPKLLDLLEEYKDSLLDNKKYEFHFDPIEIENIFGRYMTFSVNYNFLNFFNYIQINLYFYLYFRMSLKTQKYLPEEINLI